MGLRFRSAVLADIAQIVPLVESAYRGESSKLGWTTEADFLDGQRTDATGVAALLDEPASQVVLAFEDDVLVGCAHIQMHQDGCHFGMFAVQPMLQSQGVGKALLAQCEQRAVADFGAKQMCMWVIWVRESLIAFYLRRGYQKTAQQEVFPYGDARFGLPKRDDLYFIVMHKALSA
jgi:GNAT superfamily N-acetyltransferase